MHWFRLNKTLKIFDFNCEPLKLTVLCNGHLGLMDVFPKLIYAFTAINIDIAPAI